MRSHAVDVWTKDRAHKLARRLDALRSLSVTLEDGTILKTMNDRAIIDLEHKLFAAKAQLSTLSAAKVAEPMSVHQ